MKVAALIKRIIERIPESSLELWNAVFLRHHRKIVFSGALFLLGITLLFGWLSTRKVKEVVTEDFNQQQLALARHAADQISNQIDMLKRGMILLGLSPSVQYFERASLARRMGITYSSLREEAVIEIRYIEANGEKTHLTNDHGYLVTSAYREDDRYLAWSRNPESRGLIMMSEVYAPYESDNGQLLYMKMATPVWQVSVDDAHPLPSNRFSGVLVIVVDVTKLVGRLVENIKSGKTGYAWVINSSGTFLFHQERTFVGKNAFEVRREKQPSISYARINEIQKKMMLFGREGTSWYVSGWHRGSEGTIRKLIAFAPIHLQDAMEDRIWSVAVVAPGSEVEGAIHGVQIRQFILQAIIIFIILFGALTVIFFEARWSASLRLEVARQTAEYRKSEQRYRSLVEHAEDIIFKVDTAGNFLSINTYGLNFLSRGHDEIIGRNVGDIFSPQTADMMLAAIKDVIDMKRGKQVTQLVRFDDRECWLNTNYRRLLDEDGNVYAILGISRDMTDRRKMEEQSYYTEKMASLGTLAAGVAHEINNPLTIILGFTDLLKEKIPEDSDTYDVLTTIERQGLKAKKVVENLLTFARTKEHTDVDVDINSCLEEVLSVLGNNLLLNKISLKKIDLSPSLPKVKADADELQQVFFNIINNAIYAMKGGGLLSLSTRLVDGGNVEIRISDTGCGIAKEHRPRVFDPLYTTKKVGDGTGLGLSVSYGIITRHRGTIAFETKTKEENGATGTTFIIALPSVASGVTEHAPQVQA